jgi:hypothetical protein
MTDAEKVVELEAIREHKLMKVFHEHIGKMIDHLTQYVAEDLPKHDIMMLESKIQATLLQFQGQVNAEGDDFLGILKQLKKTKNKQLIKLVKEIITDIDIQYDKLKNLRKDVDMLPKKPSSRKIRNIMDTNRNITRLQEEIIALTNQLRRIIGQRAVKAELRQAA